MGESVLESEYGLDPGTLGFNRVFRQRSDDGEYRYEYELVFDSAIDSALDPVNVLVASTLVFYPNDHAKEYWFNSQGNAVRDRDNHKRCLWTFRGYRYNIQIQ